MYDNNNGQVIQVDESYRNTISFLEKAAAALGFILNPDPKALERITRYLADNKARYGKYYCPCKQHYPLDTGVDPTCPCSEAAGEIKRDGHCECHVFFDPAAIQAKRRPGLLATVTCPG